MGRTERRYERGGEEWSVVGGKKLVTYQAIFSPLMIGMVRPGSRRGCVSGGETQRDGAWS